MGNILAATKTNDLYTDFVAVLAGSLAKFVGRDCSVAGCRQHLSRSRFATTCCVIFRNLRI